MHLNPTTIAHPTLLLYVMYIMSLKLRCRCLSNKATHSRLTVHRQVHDAPSAACSEPIIMMMISNSVQDKHCCMVLHCNAAAANIVKAAATQIAAASFVIAFANSNLMNPVQDA